MDTQLLSHPVVRDALPEARDDVGVGDVWDLVADLSEALYVSMQRLSGF